MLQINQDRLWQDIEDLAQLTEPDKPWTRRAFTPMFSKGREWLKQRFLDAGLKVSLDAGGNLIGRLPGKKKDAKPIVTGSHSDTVPAGGRFDGILGVLAGLEVARTIKEAGITPSHPLEIIDFLSEEPSDFGLSCIGSRAMVGALTSEMLARTLKDGRSLADCIAQVGGNPDQLDMALRKQGDIASYLEVHIEQGPVLEKNAIDVGIVTGIAGIYREKVTFTGRADHSGTTPMDIRQDALVAASSLVGAVKEAGDRESKLYPLVATIGKFDVFPNAANAVPGSVELIVEIRSGEQEALKRTADATFAAIEKEIAAIGIQIHREELSNVAPSPCKPAVIQAIENAAATLDYSHIQMPSGAGHDGVFVSRIAPIGMIFTSCRDGRSHAPEEWAEPEACAKGTNTLLHAILDLDEVLA